MSTVTDAIDSGSSVVAFDSFSTYGPTMCTSSPCTLSHQVGSPPNAVLLVWYFCADSAAGVSTLTIDGEPAFRVGARPFMSQTGEVWDSTVTSSTTHTISVAHTCAHAYLTAMSATNVDQTNPYRATNLDGTDTATPAIGDTISSSPGDLVMDTVCHGQVVTGPGVQQTLEFNTNVASTFACGNFAASLQPGASPSVTTAWTGVSERWVTLTVRCAPGT